MVKRGELLAKVNDRQLQAQLKRLEAQIPLAEDRVFRQNALLKRDAVSKEAYEQVKTELATLNADIENIKANIDMTELRAPFDGIIGLRQVSTGAYASPHHCSSQTDQSDSIESRVRCTGTLCPGNKKRD